MAQVGIREVDAKQMYFDYIGQNYSGIQVTKLSDTLKLSEGKKYVIKPDMLFGKRGKYGLVGVNLDKNGVEAWLDQKFGSTQEISGINGELSHFIIEDFIPHEKEYYISFSAERDCDVVNFSFEGGVDVEENWERVSSIQIPLLEELTQEKIGEFKITDKKVVETILSLWKYYKSYGFVYLEVNPFCFDNNSGDLVLLDMVAKVDDQEYFKQKNNWKNLELPNTFGFKQSEAEQYIKKLDQETGASLKMKILNPQAKIWTLLAGGGGSLAVTDSLGALGYADEIGNYGELSGNPNRDFTKAYTRVLFEQMLANGTKGKYLVIAGAIANFTYIDTTFAGVIDILEEKKQELLDQEIKILVRRGGLNEKKGLAMINTACNDMGIPIQIADSSEYMTDILKEIKL